MEAAPKAKKAKAQPEPSFQFSVLSFELWKLSLPENLVH
jgi:hypothetical protein